MDKNKCTSKHINVKFQNMYILFHGLLVNRAYEPLISNLEIEYRNTNLTNFN